MPLNDDLIIDIGINEELLRQGGLAAGRVMQNFEKVSTAALGGVDKAIALVAERFTDIPEAATKSLENSKALFGKKFAEIRGLADKALAGIGTTGQLDLGVDQLRASAAASSQRAEAIEKISQAQFRLAQASGVVTKADFAALQASRAAQIAAEREAEALLRKAGALERVQIELGQTIAPQNALVAAQQRVVLSSGAARAGAQQLGFQINDVATSFASGTSVAQIFGQQLGQTVQAVQLMSGATGGLIGFLAGPWGAVVTAATILLGTFALKHFEAGDAATGQAGKEKSLTDRILEQNRTLRDNITLQAQRRSGQLSDAVASLKVAGDRKLQITKDIESQKLILSGPSGSITNTSSSNIQSRRNAAKSRIEQLKKELSAANSDLDISGQNSRLAQIQIVQAKFAGQLDRNIAQTQRYEEAVGKLNDQFRDGKISRGKFESELGVVERANKAATDILSGSGGRKAESEEKRKAREAKSAAAKAERANAKEENQLERDLKDLRGQFAPEDRAFDDFKDDISRIGKLSSPSAGKFRIGADEAARLREGALNKFKETERQLDERNQSELFKSIEAQGKLAADNIDKALQQKLDAQQSAFEAQAQLDRQEFERRDEQQRQLSGLFVDLFEGGTKRVFANFKQIGLQAVADIAARLILGGGNSGGGSGGGGGLLGSLFGGGGGDGGGGLLASLFGGGRTNGGDIVPGKFYLTGENGPELIAPRLPATVLNNRALSALGGGGGMSITINAPGATAETVSMIRRVLAEATPGLLNAAQNQTIRSINRPRLNRP